MNPITANYCANCGLPLQITQQQTQPAGAARRVLSWRNVLAAFSSGRVKLMVAVFLIEIALFFVFSGIPMSSAEYQAITSSSGYKQLDSIRAESFLARGLSIFENNYLLASIELVPLFGPALFVYVTYSTSRVLDAVGYGIPGPLLVLQILFYPHSWLELPAYAVAVTQSLLLTYAAIKRRLLEEALKTLFVWLCVGVELFFAALIETAIISLQSFGLLEPFLLWLPTAGIMYAGGLLYRRVQRRLAVGPQQAGLTAWRRG